MLTVTKKTESDLAASLGTEWGFISGLCRYEGERINLQLYQLAFMMNRSRFRWVTKSRQVGFSFIFALEALARCHLRPNHNSIFVSYNQADAIEKILLARQVYEELPIAFQKRLDKDSRTELSFISNSGKRGISRIISVPSKPPRGYKGDVVLDELAHYVDDREVYTGSAPLIIHTRGQMSGASTPLGRRGIFWEIAKEELHQYPHHSKMEVPWWLSSFFCIDVERAAEEAPEMSTEEAVGRFGTPDMIQQFESLPLDDFEQEFCCRFVDESYSYYSFALILPCTDPELMVYRDFSDIPAPKGRVVAGFDVGRARDKSELAVFEELGGRFVCRMLRSYNQVPFAEQEAELRQMLEILPVARLSIDRSGIGMNLAENLERDYPQVVPENFTSDTKERWATDFKILLQRRDVVLPRDRELVAQIHSIKRRVLASGKVAFDAEKTRKGHADRYWAVVLAVQKERGRGLGGKAKVGARVVG